MSGGGKHFYFVRKGLRVSVINRRLKLAVIRPPTIYCPCGDFDHEADVASFLERAIRERFSHSRELYGQPHGLSGNPRETTRRVLSNLTARDERVLRMRFGIDMNTDHTLEEVGQQFSITRERIRQIEAKALAKLKHPSRSGKLRSFLDY